MAIKLIKEDFFEILDLCSKNINVNIFEEGILDVENIFKIAVKNEWIIGEMKDDQINKK